MLLNRFVRTLQLAGVTFNSQGRFELISFLIIGFQGMRLGEGFCRQHYGADIGGINNCSVCFSTLAEKEVNRH